MSPLHHHPQGYCHGTSSLFYPLGLVALVCVFLMLCWLWPNDAASPQQPIGPTTLSRRKRSTEPKPFAGLTQRPPCALCEREATQASEPPLAPPEPLPPTHRRPRTVETSQHFYPHGAVAIGAGWGWGTCAPMAIPVAARGANAIARLATATFWRPTARFPWQTGGGGTHRARLGVFG
jgi:hypothetical protein